MKEIIAIILEDPKSFVLDFISLLCLFGGWLAMYIVLSCAIA